MSQKTEIDALLAKKEKFSVEEAKQLYPVMERFMEAYGSQSESGDAEWLSAALKTEHPEKSPEEIQALADKIRQSVIIWDENMASLTESCEQGISKEEWLADRLQEASVGTNVSEYGEDLSSANEMLHLSNQAAMDAVDGKDGLSSMTPVADEIAKENRDWSTYEARAEAARLGKEIEVSNLAGMVLQSGWKLMDSLPEKQGFSGIKQVADALRSGNDQGVKEAATAALKSGIERGYVPLLPKNTPLSTVSGVACFGVEQAKIMLQYAEGDISGRKALELSGRTAIAMIAHPLSKKFEAIGERIGQQIGQKVGMLVSGVAPFIAPVATVVGSFVGAAVGRLAGSAVGKAVQKGAEKIVEVAKPVLKTAWEGIKSAGRCIMNGVKSIWESIFG